MKQNFQPDDVRARAVKTLEKCILQGTTHMRTHLEVDPVVGLRSLDGIQPLVEEYKWAIDLEICVFPQEGLLNNPGTDELMIEGLKRGCHVVGGAPYTEQRPAGADRPALRDGTRVRRRRRHAPGFRQHPRGHDHRARVQPHRGVRLRGTGHRGPHDAVVHARGPGSGAHHPTSCRRRRRGDGPAVHRSLPDGAGIRTTACCAAWYPSTRCCATGSTATCRRTTC